MRDDGQHDVWTISQIGVHCSRSPKGEADGLGAPSGRSV
jgi:hypothetical protein